MANEDELSTISAEELVKALALHAQWVQDKTQGGKAELRKYDLRPHAELFRRLHPRRLHGIDLRDCDLRGLQLRNYKLAGAYLMGADLRRTELVNSDLRKARLAGADFREADLDGADLTGVSGFQAERFAGAKVAGAKLPEEVADFASVLDWLAEASRSARKTLALVLIGCLYSWLTILTTTGSEQITLPVINVAVPLSAFYVMAPAALLAVSVYLQIYLQRLWEVLSGLPATFPDGRPLDRRAYPWIINGIVRRYFYHLRKDEAPPYSRLQFASALVAWWAVPFTIWAGFLLAGRTRINDVVLSAGHAVAAVIAVTAAVSSQRNAASTLLGEMWEQLWGSRGAAPQGRTTTGTDSDRRQDARESLRQRVVAAIEHSSGYLRLLVTISFLIIASLLLTGDNRVSEVVYRGLLESREAVRAEIIELINRIAES